MPLGTRDSLQLLVVALGETWQVPERARTEQELLQPRRQEPEPPGQEKERLEPMERAEHQGLGQQQDAPVTPQGVTMGPWGQPGWREGGPGPGDKLQPWGAQWEQAGKGGTPAGLMAQGEGKGVVGEGPWGSGGWRRGQL